MCLFVLEAALEVRPTLLRLLLSPSGQGLRVYRLIPIRVVRVFGLCGSLGDGKVKLFSAAVQIGIKYQPSKKH